MEARRKRKNRRDTLLSNRTERERSLEVSNPWVNFSFFNELERCWIILGRAWPSSRLHLECPHTCSYLSSWTTMATLAWCKFTVKPWVSMGILAMYEWSCQACTWSQHMSCCLSLVACLVTRLSDSYHSLESKLPCVLPMHSTWIIFALTLFHTDPAVWQLALTLVLTTEVHVTIDMDIHLKFYNKWSVQTSKHTHTCVQCSHASVRLAQARPN